MTDAQKKVVHPTPLPAATDKLNGAQQFIQTELEKAHRLITARKRVLAEMADYRLMLDRLKEQATKAQRDWIAENLPKRTRDSKDDDQATSDETQKAA